MVRCSPAWRPSGSAWSTTVVPRTEVVARLASSRRSWHTVRPGPSAGPSCRSTTIVKERVNLLMEASMALEQVTFETADHREATARVRRSAQAGVRRWLIMAVTKDAVSGRTPRPSRRSGGTVAAAPRDCRRSPASRRRLHDRDVGPDVHPSARRRRCRRVKIEPPSGDMVRQRAAAPPGSAPTTRR